MYVNICFYLTFASPSYWTPKFIRVRLTKTEEPLQRSEMITARSLVHILKFLLEVRVT